MPLKINPGRCDSTWRVRKHRNRMRAMNPNDENPYRRRTQWGFASLALWFPAGFLIIFVGMAIMVRMFAMSPDGRSLIMCRLWQYYLISIRTAVNANGAIGPTSGAGRAALVILIQHLLCAVAGGVVAMGVGWGVRRLRPR